MILIHDIRLPLSAGEPQAYEKALRLARIQHIFHICLERFLHQVFLCSVISDTVAYVELN